MILKSWNGSSGSHVAISRLSSPDWQKTLLTCRVI